MKRLPITRPVCVLLLLAFLSGCAAPAGTTASSPEETEAGIPRQTASLSGDTAQAPSQETESEDTEGTAPDAQEAVGGYVIPPFLDAVFDPAAARAEGSVEADLSGLAQGYIAIRATSSKRLKFQVILGDVKYNYDLPNDGTPTVFPLSLGSGSYTFRVMENAADSKYLCIWKESREVTLEDEFQPFLRPSQMSAYSDSSRCVEKARELAAQCDTDAEVVSQVYEFLSGTIRYDYDKAASVQSGYLPDPDETLATQTGICFDYASLAAAMLRSVGIPCKLIVGYVTSGGKELYHAWNSFYLKDQGWVTVEIQAKPNIWQRVDITFAASGVDTEILTNDSLYTTRYTY